MKSTILYWGLSQNYNNKSSVIFAKGSIYVNETYANKYRK